MLKSLLIAGLALAVIAGSAAAETAGPKPAAAAEIDFANHGGIWDWKAESKDALLVKSRDGRYFRATFMAPCFSLPFAERVGFVTDPRDVLDQFGSIDVGHEHCVFTSFTEIPKPGNW